MMRKTLIFFSLFLSILLFSDPLRGRAQSSDPLADGVLTVGMECGYAPFNWTTNTKTETAQPIAGTNSYCDGFDVVMATEIARLLGVKLEIRAMEWDGLIPALQNHVIDAIIAGMSPTEERKQSINFSDIYYKSEQVIVVRKDSPYTQATSVDDFEGASISAQLGTLQEQLINQLKGAIKAAPLPDYPTLVTALKSQTIDGFIAEEPVAIQILNNNPELMMVRLTEKGFILDESEISIAIGLRKSDTDFLIQINEALSQIPVEQRNQWMVEAIQRSSSTDDGDHEAIPEGFWPAIGFLLKTYYPLFLQGIYYTLIVSLIGTLIGLVLALFITPLKLLQVTRRDSTISRVMKRLTVFLSTAYVEILRGTPMMVQAVIIYYGLAGMNVDLSIHLFGWTIRGIMVTGILVVSINTSAYIVEVLRGSIEAISKGQMEAALSLGMSRAQAMRLIILPQALRNSIPALGNEFVINIKDTSVLTVISVTELFFMTRRVNAIYYRQTEGFIITAIIYFILTFAITRLLYWISRRIDGRKRVSFPTSQSFYQEGGVEHALA